MIGPAEHDPRAPTLVLDSVRTENVPSLDLWPAAARGIILHMERRERPSAGANCAVPELANPARSTNASAAPVTRSVVVALVFLLLAVAARGTLDAPSAEAAIAHESLPELSAKLTEGVPAGSGASVTGPIQDVTSMTMDGHSLWVSERTQGNSRADAFDGIAGAWQEQLTNSSGILIASAASGIAVGHATKERDVYVAAEKTSGHGPEFLIAAFGPSGTLSHTWNGADTLEGFLPQVFSLAVDESSSIADWASGDVYVGATNGFGATGVVDVFKPLAGGQEEYVTKLPEPEPEPGVVVPFGQVRQVAVDQSNGDVFVQAGSGLQSVIYVFEPVAGAPKTYQYLTRIQAPNNGPFGAEPTGIVVDASAHDLFVALGSEGVYEYKLGVNDTTASAVDHIDGTATEKFAGPTAIALDQTSHDLFVADFNTTTEEGKIDAFGPDRVVPDVRTSPPEDVTPTSAKLVGTVNPLGAGPATCAFAWGTTPQFGHFAPCRSTIPNGSTETPADSTIEGLEPDTHYVYRLQATNANGTNQGEPAQNVEFVTPGPGLAGAWSFEVNATSATLDAKIDPHGSPTSFYFDVGTTASYGLHVPAPPGANVGSGNGAVVAAPQQLYGLSPSTVYHYRLAVVSELSAGEQRTFFGQDQTFSTRSGSTAAVADGRHWELVSPPEKHGALVEAINQEGLIQAAREGNAITYHADAPVTERPAGYANEAQVLATRGASGWVSQDISIPHLSATAKAEGFGEDYRFFTEDLARSIVQPRGRLIPASSSQALAPAEASEQTAFLREDFSHSPGGLCASLCFHPLVTGAPGYANVPEGTKFGQEGVCPALKATCGPEFMGASADGAHVILRGHVALTNTPIPAQSALGGGQLYEWTAGRLTLVTVLPPSEGGVPPEGTPLLGYHGTNVRNAVSNDGTRVFFAANNGHLYMRDLTTETTVRLDQVDGGTGSGNVEANFQIASSDGSRVFFTDKEALTPNAGTLGTTRDLYECKISRDVQGRPVCSLSDVTPKVGNQVAGVLGHVIGASEDGSAVYFAANGAFAPGAVEGTCEEGQSHSAPGQQCNIYRYSNGELRLVSVVSHQDDPDWGIDEAGFADLTVLTGRVSTDGNLLVFESQNHLTHYDNTDAATGEPAEEVYLYDAATQRVRCVSCNPTGARPQAALLGAQNAGLGVAPLIDENHVWKGGKYVAALVPGWTPYANLNAHYQSRYLDDRGRVFFDSYDPLVPQDHNKTWDVYEYEPAGIGTCSAASATFSSAAAGCIGLVSSGESGEESAFVDASESGRDVFFLTSARLSPQDFDTSRDLYDAHECTSESPCIEPPQTSAPEPCASGEACQSPASPPPALLGPPPSSLGSASGNVHPLVAAGAAGSAQPTRAQLLAKALARCKKAPRKQRKGCEAAARRRYGPKHAAGKKAGKKAARAPQHKSSKGRKR